jgi:hypothetical protein
VVDTVAQVQARQCGDSTQCEDSTQYGRGNSGLCRAFFVALGPALELKLVDRLAVGPNLVGDLLDRLRVVIRFLQIARSCTPPLSGLS